MSAILPVGYDIKGGWLANTWARVHAVAGVSFKIAPGRDAGAGGESGCGKVHDLQGRCSGSSGGTARSGRWPGDAWLGPGPMKRVSRRKHPRWSFRILTRRLDHAHGGPAILLPNRLSRHGVGWDRRCGRVAALFKRVGLTPETDAAVHRTNFPAVNASESASRPLPLLVARKSSSPNESVSALGVSGQAASPRSAAGSFRTSSASPTSSSRTIWPWWKQISHKVCRMYLGQIVENGHPSQILRRSPTTIPRRLLDAVPIRRTDEAPLKGGGPVDRASSLIASKGAPVPRG